MDLGMNLVQEAVQVDLLKEQTKRSRKDKSAGVMHAIMSLKKNIETSKEKNVGFIHELTKCRFCSFKTESQTALEHHLESPHITKMGFVRCNFCRFEHKVPLEVANHMLLEHGVRGRLERLPAVHQCPQCPYEDNMKGKLTRHKAGCDKRFRGERNQEPPHDWEPPAKIPKPAQIRGGRPNIMAGSPGFMGAGAAAGLAAKQNPMMMNQFNQNRKGMPPQLQFGPRGAQQQANLMDRTGAAAAAAAAAMMNRQAGSGMNFMGKTSPQILAQQKAAMNMRNQVVFQALNQQQQ